MPDTTHATAPASLVELGGWLKQVEYRFTTTTPETHRRPRPRSANSLRRLLGWTEFVLASEVPSVVLDLLIEADAVIRDGESVRSVLRCSSFRDELYFHSAYPTSDKDSVFFGPDSYRFARFIASAIPSAHTIVDIGCGSGIGGISLARHLSSTPRPLRLIMTDVNERALALTAVNAAVNSLPDLEILRSDVLSGLPNDTESDAIISNPPFMADSGHRAYRDGGGSYGSGLSLRIARESLERLPTGGILALYTGACIVDGRDMLLAELEPILAAHASTIDWRYEEIDPDIFGEELERDAYRNVERIAAVGLIAKKK